LASIPFIASVSAIFFRLSRRVGPATVAAAAKVRNLWKEVVKNEDSLDI